MLKYLKTCYTLLTLFTLILVSQTYAKEPIAFGTYTENDDTTCFKTERAEFYVKFAEKYFITVKLLDEKDTIIQSLETKNQAKTDQLQLLKTLAESQRDEIQKLKRNNKILIFGISGLGIAVILLSLL